MTTFSWDNYITYLKLNLSRDDFNLIFSNSSFLDFNNSQLIIKIDDIAFLFVNDQTGEIYQNILQLSTKFSGRPITLIFSNEDVPNLNLSLDNQKKETQNEFKTLNLSTKLSTQSSSFQTNLRKNLTFDNYFYSFENKKLIKACNMLIDTIDNPEFNPFFIYGASGIGKTHLISALGNELNKKFPDLKIYYSTATDFLEEYTNLFKGGLNNVDATDNFKEKFYQLDVFILDDIQLLEGKESTLNEFFSIFEKLRNNNKLMVISSDKKPQEIHFEERLITRFTSGLTVEITVPNSDTKKQIFSYYAHQKDLNIEEAAVEVFISNSTNIRSLLGYLNAITLYSINENYDSFSFSKENALDLVNTSTGNINNLTADEIIMVVCDHFDLSKMQIKEKTRKSEIVVARRFAAYFLHTKLNISYKRISLYLGLKEHSTALRAVNEIKNNNKTEKYLKNYEELCKLLNK